MAHILLLAEPSLTIQRVVQLTFANEDIDVVVASDGAEAIEQAERLRPSIVLADVALARMSGYDVAAHFKRHPRFSGVPVVLLSGAFERVDAARAAECGCDLVLSKPFEPRHLLAHVRGLLPGAPTGRTPEDAALDGAARATPAGFLSVAPHEGYATAIEPQQAPVHGVAPEPPKAHTVETAPGVPDAEPVDTRGSGFLVPVPAADPLQPSVTSMAELVPPDWCADPVAPPSAPPVPVTEPVPAAAPEAPHDFPPSMAAWMQLEQVEPPKLRRSAEQPDQAVEPVPSFEMLALTNKSMRLVPPQEAPEEPDADVQAADPIPGPEAESADHGAGHDLGGLIPSLDDYFDQLDAAFASGVDTTFRRAPDAVPGLGVPPPEAPLPPRSAKQEVVPAVQPPPAQPPPAAPVQQAAPPPESVVQREEPAVSPFSTLRLERSAPTPAPPAPSATIDDAYDALMKQLQEPKARPSVVALRADDELLVERAVERVLAQIDVAALREGMTDVVTNLAKKVIAEEIERIRRP